ncbi:Tol-Pal system beta propeller repeat protein TolB [Aquisalimonas sp.]|uniref:Tol-Pal system beta propeller repeat protein TolB n=1 Tax=unclassified Aquisalimonas TaxID=2644645 RepID=UPI0025B98E84|nr:Tol-Pal system beta propeller repeat protein TolB [Aquisalimonas sp.]
MHPRLKALAAAALTLGFLPGLAKAELVVEITQGAEAALPIAVAEFGDDGDAPPEDIATIIRNNLLRSGQFDPLPQEEFIDNPTRSDDVRYENWRALGVDNLVVGETRRDGDNFQVRFELLDVFTGDRMLGRSFRVQPGSLRAVAHVISDSIHEELLDRPGAFNTMVAYVAINESGEEREFELIVADADGHDPQSILTSSEPLLSPAWAPDRERLAYVSFEGRRSEIFVQNIRTGERDNIASFRGLNSAPAWSPEGNTLAVTLSKDGQTDIYALDVETGSTTQITNHYSIDTEAAWSPDGESIYFTSDRAGNPNIFRADADGGNVERITYEGTYNASPDISPDGEQLAMVHRTDDGFRIAVQDLNRDRFRVVSEGPHDESPSFAPNGALLVYATRQDGVGVLGTASMYGEARHIMATEGRTLREPAWSPQ